LAKQLIDKGFYLSFNPAVFKKNDFNFAVIPIEKIFLETDNNDSISIEYVYQNAAKCFGLTIDDLKEKNYTNFTNLFSTNGR
jgi:Tat protein secretion system quality control protein TatD with DNase activity